MPNASRLRISAPAATPSARRGSLTESRSCASLNEVDQTLKSLFDPPPDDCPGASGLEALLLLSCKVRLGPITRWEIAHDPRLPRRSLDRVARALHLRLGRSSQAHGHFSPG